MKTSFVSSQAISTALRYSLTRMQSEVTRMQKEVTTGRVADLGLALGARAGQSVSLSRDIERLKGIIDSNSIASSRLKTTQDLLDQLASKAEAFRSTLSSDITGDSNAAVAKSDALVTLQSMMDILNTSFNGEHLFAGINTDVQPITDYTAAGAANKAAFDTAFQTYFGFTQTDPQVSSITAAQMQDFLDTTVEPQFLGAGWAANWSDATDEQIVSRIALQETAQTSVSANNESIQKLAMAASSVYELLQGPLGDAARGVLFERAVGLVTEAIAGITNTRAQVGLVQSRVQAASERLSMQVDLFTLNVADLEGVDYEEASIRISSLLTQIETAYALTARIQQLSLIRHLS